MSNETVRVAFDPAKDIINQQRHEGLSLALARRFDWHVGLIVPTYPGSDEARWKLLTRYDGVLYAVIFTLRDGGVWVMSLRRASRTERRAYVKATA